MVTCIDVVARIELPCHAFSILPGCIYWSKQTCYLTLCVTVSVIIHLFVTDVSTFYCRTCIPMIKRDLGGAASSCYGSLWSKQDSTGPSPPVACEPSRRSCRRTESCRCQSAAWLGDRRGQGVHHLLQLCKYPNVAYDLTQMMAWQRAASP